MKALIGAFNQDKALVWAFSVITNLRMDPRLKLYCLAQVAAAQPTAVAGAAACPHQGAGTEGRGRGRQGPPLGHGVVVVAGHSRLHRGRGGSHWSSLLLVSQQWQSSG